MDTTSTLNARHRGAERRVGVQAVVSQPCVVSMSDGSLQLQPAISRFIMCQD
jgi:hypothetical protein